MEMETSTEPMDPLTPTVAALAVQPEGGCGEDQGARSVGWSFCCCLSFSLMLSFLDLKSCLCAYTGFIKPVLTRGLKGARKMR